MNNILITSAGQRVSLVNSFKEELSKAFSDSQVFTADINPVLAPACHVSDKFFVVPRATENDYVEAVLRICVENDVKLVIPTIDTELLVLSNSLDKFHSLGIQLLISDPEFVQLCRDKRKTNNYFELKGIEVPKQYDSKNLTYPVFVKPYDGSLSKGIFIAHTSNDVKPEHLNNPKLMFMEYVPADNFDEFTVDCYYDRDSFLKCVVPRKRIFVRAGEVNKGVTRKNKIVDEFFSKLDSLQGARGCITIQVFLNKVSNQILGIEINPRFGGGYPLSYLAGANYSKWVIDEYLRNQEVNTFLDWKDNLLMLRYDAEVLVNDYQD